MSKYVVCTIYNIWETLRTADITKLKIPTMVKSWCKSQRNISAQEQFYARHVFNGQEKKVCGKNYKVLSGMVIDFSFLKVVNQWSVFFAESSGKIHAPWQVFQLSDFQLWHCATTPILHIRKSASKKYAISSCYVTTFYYWSKAR